MSKQLFSWSQFSNLICLLGLISTKYIGKLRVNILPHSKVYMTKMSEQIPNLYTVSPLLLLHAGLLPLPLDGVQGPPSAHQPPNYRTPPCIAPSRQTEKECLCVRGLLSTCRTSQVSLTDPSQPQPEPKADLIQAVGFQGGNHC
jgi:hypothetical protein